VIEMAKLNDEYVNLDHAEILVEGISRTGFRPHIALAGQRGEWYIIWDYHPYGDVLYKLSEEEFKELKERIENGEGYNEISSWLERISKEDDY